ncbi:probable folate-biopterin transporter 6 [Cucurbita moschata]|uniref:Probable folate-biopterin transporter 6 n=1 Tax=Cucurbita moschata TaxID=3662 RepID=A0A6J1HEZ6_CUCMO|nr:probable folate-biopterin transporter 6 [Cucurbita moschata]
MDLYEAPKMAKRPNSDPSDSNKLLSIMAQPFRWFKMLSSELNPSFIAGVVLVYGLSHGFSGSYFKVVSDYYWKDVQKLQPSVVQIYIGIYTIPWVMKPIWGLLTDAFPVRGYLRRPYFVIAGVVGTASAVAVAMKEGLGILGALGLLIGISAAMAIADVTIDACIVRSSIEVRWLAQDLQSLCGACSSIGHLIGYSTSGVFVHLLGAQEALGILAIPPAMIIVLGFFIHEPRSSTLQSYGKPKGESLKQVGVAIRDTCKAIKYPHVWKPALFMFLCLSLSISTHEGQFYWYTDKKAGPAFSQESVGLIYAVGSAASLIGVLIYHKTLRDVKFRRILFFAQLFYGVAGLLDVVFILRWNLVLKIPDELFVVLEECVSRIVSRIRWTPMMVLNTRLCSVGIEGTFFALLACIDSLGMLCSKWSGGLVLHAFGVTRSDFRNLWLVVLLRSLLRFVVLAFVFLVPDASQSDILVPSDQTVSRKSSTTVEEDGDSIPLVSMKGEGRG